MLESMRRGKFRIGDLPNVLILDTQLVAFRLGAEHNIRLVDLLKRLQIRTQGACLHNGGNDAYFTLRALLMLAVRSCNVEAMSKDQRVRKDLLEAVVGIPIPFPRCPRIVSVEAHQTKVLECSQMEHSQSGD